MDELENLRAENAVLRAEVREFHDFIERVYISLTDQLSRRLNEDAQALLKSGVKKS